MSWLPTFTLPALPTLPSFPSISLPSQLQNRFISYLLRQSLGKFVKPNSFNFEKIDAQISNGRIQLGVLELDEEVLSGLIGKAGLGVRCVAGRIEGCLVKLPLPNIWTGELGIGVDGVTIELEVDEGNVSGMGRNDGDLNLDMEKSVMHITNNFMETDLTPSEILQLRNIPTLETDANSPDIDPFSPDDNDNNEDPTAPGGFPSSRSPSSSILSSGDPPPSTVLASIIEGLLSRLHVNVGQVKVILRHVQQIDQGRKDGKGKEGKEVVIEYELRLDGIVYFTEGRNSSLDKDMLPDKYDGKNGPDRRESVSRIITVKGISGWMTTSSSRQTTSPGPQVTLSTRNRRRSSSSMKSPSNSTRTLSPRPSFIRTPSSSDSIATLSPGLKSRNILHYGLDTSSRIDGELGDAATFGDGEETDEMMMSRGIADLRESVVAFVDQGRGATGKSEREGREDIDQDGDSGESMQRVEFDDSDGDGDEGSLYESALEEDEDMEVPDLNAIPDIDSPFEGPPQQGDALSSPASQDRNLPSSTSSRRTTKISSSATRILSFGDEGLTCRFTHQKSEDTRPQKDSVEIEIGRVSIGAGAEEMFGLLRTVYALGEAEDTVEASGKTQQRHKRQGVGESLALLSVKSLEIKAFHNVSYLGSERSRLPHLSLTLGEVSIRQRLSATDSEISCSIQEIQLNHESGSRTTPIIIFDPTLPYQYAIKPAEELPNHADIDGWSHRILLDRPRRTRKKSSVYKRAVTGADDRDEKNLPAAQILMSAEGDLAITLQPAELAIDWTVVDELIPFLRKIPFPVSGNSVDHPSNSHATGTSLSVSCLALRVSLSEPPATSEVNVLSDRTGDMTLDVRSLSMKLGLAVDAESDAGLGIGCRHLAVFHRPSDSNVSSSVVVLGAFTSHDIQEETTTSPLLISFHPGEVDHSSYPTITVPSLQIFLDRAASEGLQYYANDLAKWLDSQLNGSHTSPRRDLKMIGSRFFSANAFADNASSTSSESEETYGRVAEIMIVDMRCRLSLGMNAGSPRYLLLVGADLGITAQTAPDIQGIGASISLQGMSVTDDVDGLSAPLVWTPTPDPGVDTSPCLHLNLASKTGPVEQTKESSTKISVSGLHIWASPDSDLWPAIRRLLKPPKGVFQDMVPSDVSNIQVQLSASIVYLPNLNLAGALGVVITEAAFRTRLVADALETVTRVSLMSSQVLAMDLLREGLSIDLARGQTWKDGGFVELLRSSEAHLTVKQNKVMETIQVEINGGQSEAFLAADSRGTLLSLTYDIVSAWTAAPKIESESTAQRPIRSTRIPPAASGLESSDIFRSIDQDAFRKADRFKDPTDRIDMLEDDLPHHPKYLANATISRNSRRGKHIGIRDQGDQDFADEDCHIEIFDSTPFALYADHYSNLERQADEKPTLPPRATFNLEVSDFDLTLHLYDGYDWPATRHRIEAEVRAMRRNLIKVRQLLASGQQPREPTGTSESYLYNSILVGLPEDTDFADLDEALMAIDEELDLLGDETASQGSALPTRNARQPVDPRHTPSPAPTKGLGKLTRSSKHQMELIFKGASWSTTSFQPGNLEVRRSQFECDDIQIIDHIRSSTWKSFLTEWRAERQGSLREAGARFFRAELVDLMQPGSQDTESRLRIKVLPLRFHVDQDAISFLNRFLGFRAEVPVAKAEVDAPAGRPSPGRFFQYVEVFPIEVKMDYKPKRIDFKAITKGKTAELLNLFHFEGSKMTLRHVTLNGVSGWGNVYSKLCELWAPDVAANQLSDVATGVAPIRSAVNLGNGMADLILLPISQYKRTGKIAKGLKRGTGHFVKATASEALNMGLQIATGTQIILEKAHNALGTPFDEEMDGETMEDSVVLTKDPGEHVKVHSRYANQPENVSQGFVAAYEALSRNLTGAAQTILAVPMEVYENSGGQSPARMVVRAVPIAMLKTMIGVTDASRQAMFGLKNEFRPGVKADIAEKYKEGLRSSR